MSAPAPNKNRQHSIKRRMPGFTLIEILVVLVIVGIIVAAALLSLGTLGDDRNLQTQARRLTTLLQMATDDATIQGRDFGIEVMTAGYRFVEHDPLLNQWFEVTDDDLMRERKLEEGTEFELVIEEHRVLLEDESQESQREEEDIDERDLTDDYLPHILILSSGDTSPFELRIVRSSDRAEVLVRMSAAGELKIVNDDDDPL
ncbi:MAG: type II secretion system minor pseudopilin GspH [Woeseiaceae bacterium]|jgi:general secretion pathway protein H|nr:type II secretion system minor pseudopilin GspH [Woeseiaceae bacterium]